MPDYTKQQFIIYETEARAYSEVRRMFELTKKYGGSINLTLGELGFATPSLCSLPLSRQFTTERAIM